MIDVSRETNARLKEFVALLLQENRRQNLIGRSTVEDVWERHIADSAQLLRLAPKGASRWLDIGSGGGLPGLVVALLTEAQVTLAEPRRLRADFLQRAVSALALESRVTVVADRAERLKGSFDVITARAVASMDTLLEISHHLSTDKSVWLLPKGKKARLELDEARRAWQGYFRLEQSETSREAAIIVASSVRRKGRG